MNPKYSVIIPVYNAEKTLRRCVDSLLSQKREDVEIILINDGSTDNGREICEQYEKEYQQVIFVDKENGGVSTARNAGLDVASGEYITFVDSDDWVTDDYFLSIDDVLSEYNYDFIRFSFCTARNINAGISAKSRETAISKIIEDICNKSINGPVAKIYKREIVSGCNVRFPEGASIAEDRAFNIAYSTHIKSYRVSSKQVYFVSTENENSLSRKHQDNLDEQFAITGKYARDAIFNADISAEEKRQYFAAMNFGDARVIYKRAKDLRRGGVSFFKRLKILRKHCREINQKQYDYPKTRYCTLITLPIRFNLVLVIDLMVWVLLHR